MKDHDGPSGIKGAAREAGIPAVNPGPTPAREFRRVPNLRAGELLTGERRDGPGGPGRGKKVHDGPFSQPGIKGAAREASIPATTARRWMAMATLPAEARQRQPSGILSERGGSGCVEDRCLLRLWREGLGRG